VKKLLIAAALFLGVAGGAMAQKGHAYGKSKHDKEHKEHTRRHDAKETKGSEIREDARHHGRVTAVKRHGKITDDATARKQHGRLETMKGHGKPTWQDTTGNSSKSRSKARK
jgi:hypothetical protein